MPFLVSVPSRNLSSKPLPKQILFNFFKHGILSEKRVYYAKLSSYRRSLKNARHNHTKALLRSFGNSSAKPWGFINLSCGRARSGITLPRGAPGSPHSLSLNDLAQYFSSIGSSTAPTESSLAVSALPHIACLPPLSLKYIDPLSLKPICKTMKRSYKHAKNEVPSMVIFNVLDLISIPIAFIFNVSLPISLPISLFQCLTEFSPLISSALL